MLRRLGTLLGRCLLGRCRFHLRWLDLRLFGRSLFRRRGLGWFGVLVGILVVTPEGGFCEAAMVLLVLIFVGVVPTRLGHRQRTEQRQARHKAQPGFDCFAHKASSFWRIVQGLMGAHK